MVHGDNQWLLHCTVHCFLKPRFRRVFSALVYNPRFAMCECDVFLVIIVQDPLLELVWCMSREVQCSTQQEFVTTFCDCLLLQCQSYVARWWRSAPTWVSCFQRLRSCRTGTLLQLRQDSQLLNVHFLTLKTKRNWPRRRTNFVLSRSVLQCTLCYAVVQLVKQNVIRKE